MDRRQLLRSSLASITLVVWPSSSRAGEEVAVPIPLQMELLLKVASYDKNLPARAQGLVRLVILTRNGSAQSDHVAQQAVRALEGKAVNHFPIEVSTLAYTDGPTLARRVRERGAAILYATPGFGSDDMQSIARALAKVSILSSGALARFVENGVVLSFDLVSGKPKLLVHLRRARAQGVALSSQVLKLAKVFQ